MNRDSEPTPAFAWALIACFITGVQIFSSLFSVAQAWGNGGGNGPSAWLSLIFFAALTVGAVLAEREACKRLGAAEFLEKIVSIALLIPCVLISAASVLATLYGLYMGLFLGIQSVTRFAHSEPVKWTHLVKVAGQPEPVPEEWLQDAEARIAHSLKLPETVPKPVPFDFKAAYWRSWLPSKPKVAVQYFNHLCSTEAGEWIFRNEQNVEGLYFARPQHRPGQLLTYTYELENPWVQRFLFTFDDKPLDGASWLIQPPHYNYRFVEQPRRDVAWQKGITEPYIRLFGFTTERERDYQGRLVDSFKQTAPMQAIGIPIATARFGYTWRGVKRPQDREHGIAGGEVLIYDMQTKEVLAVRRQFLLGNAPSDPNRVVWGPARSCPQLHGVWGTSIEFSQFAFDVLQTTEPSTAGKK